MKIRTIVSVTFLLIGYFTLAQFIQSPTNGSNTYFSGGNVGIGISSPTKTFDVRGDIINGQISSTIYGDNTIEGRGAVLRLKSYGNAITSFNQWTLYSHTTNGNLYFRSESESSSAVDHVTFQSNGKVGIGTGAPGMALDVEENANGNTGIEVTNTNSGNLARSAISLGNGSSGHSTYLLSTSANYTGISTWQNSGVLGTDSQKLNGLVLRSATGGIRFQPGGIADKIVFEDNGYVGIGTTSPDEKLTVAGNIHAQEVKVTIGAGTGPDYVFEPDYNLPTLESIETFIKSEKHLPEIPSAYEMEENGVQLGEMNMLLLKKIEELTLYVIEQNKRIEKLEDNSK